MNIEKRYAIVLGGLLLLAIGVYIVNAYDINMDAGTPNVMGHSSGEIHVDLDNDGVFDKTLQQAIDDGDFSGSGPAVETDPEVGTVNDGGWCVGDSAGVVQCNQPFPFLIEVAGNKNYFPSGLLGGALIATTETSWTTEATINFVMQGEYRFYWGYNIDVDNADADWRILKNGAVIVGPYHERGTTGGDPWDYVTNDISVMPGDVIKFQVNADDGYTATTKIWIRGEYLTGIFNYY